MLVMVKMAKSIRSKHRRKMRAIKRENFGKKELERLKGVLEKAKANEDVDMKEIYTEKPIKELKAETIEKMDTSKGVKKYDPVTMKDEHGSYPVWMNQRKIRKRKRSQKRKEKKVQKNTK
ncbi:hypothetical protein ACF0H5_015675 [Mactra antiquata]